MGGEVLNEPDSLNPIVWVMNTDYDVARPFGYSSLFQLLWIKTVKTSGV